MRMRTTTEQTTKKKARSFSFLSLLCCVWVVCELCVSCVLCCVVCCVCCVCVVSEPTSSLTPEPTSCPPPNPPWPCPVLPFDFVLPCLELACLALNVLPCPDLSCPVLPVPSFSFSLSFPRSLTTPTDAKNNQSDEGRIWCWLYGATWKGGVAVKEFFGRQFSSSDLNMKLRTMKRVGFSLRFSGVVRTFHHCLIWVLFEVPSPIPHTVGGRIPSGDLAHLEILRFLSLLFHWSWWVCMCWLGRGDFVKVVMVCLWCV